MHYLIHLLVIITLLSISGCGIYPKAKNIAEIAPAVFQSKSLIVGSVTQSSDGDPTGFDDPVQFYIRRKGAAGGYRLESAEIERPFSGPPNRARADPGLEEQHGKLFAVQLEPGTYQLIRFAILWPSQQNVDFTNPVEFELLPGEVVYLGSFHAQFCVRHAYANQYGVTGVIVSVTDHMSRDEPLLRDRFAALRHAHITKRILSNEALGEQVSSLRKGCRLALT